MVKFRIGFTVEAETLFALMAKFLPVDDLHVEEVMIRERPSPPLPANQYKLTRPKRTQHRLRAGPNLKEGINSVIMDLLSDAQPHRAIDLKPRLKARGFSPNAASSRLQALQQHGVVDRVGDGTWRLAKAYLPGGHDEAASVAHG